MIAAYYGKNGVMSEGWDSEEEAEAEFEEWYENDPDFDGCYVTKHNGKWVIAFDSDRLIAFD